MPAILRRTQAAFLLLLSLVAALLVAPGLSLPRWCARDGSSDLNTAYATCPKSPKPPVKPKKCLLEVPITAQGQKLANLISQSNVTSKWFHGADRIDWMSGYKQGASNPYAYDATVDRKTQERDGEFVASIAQRLGIYLAHPPRSLSKTRSLASVQNLWIRSKEAKGAGWTKIADPKWTLRKNQKAIRAQRLANQGRLVIFVLSPSKDSRGVGFTGVVHPSKKCRGPIAKEGPQVSVASVCNFENVPLRTAMGCHLGQSSIRSVDYFVFMAPLTVKSINYSGVYTFGRRDHSSAIVLAEQAHNGDLSVALLTSGKLRPASWVYSGGVVRGDRTFKLSRFYSYHKDANDVKVTRLKDLKAMTVTAPVTRLLPFGSVRSAVVQAKIDGKKRRGTLYSHSESKIWRRNRLGWWWAAGQHGNSAFGLFITRWNKASVRGYLLGYDATGAPTWGRVHAAWKAMSRKAKKPKAGLPKRNRRQQRRRNRRNRRRQRRANRRGKRSGRAGGSAKLQIAEGAVLACESLDLKSCHEADPLSHESAVIAVTQGQPRRLVLTTSVRLQKKLFQGVSSPKDLEGSSTSGHLDHQNHDSDTRLSRKFIVFDKYYLGKLNRKQTKRGRKKGRGRNKRRGRKK